MAIENKTHVKGSHLMILLKFLFLKLLSKSRHRNSQLLPVFRYSAPRDGIALLFQNDHQLFVGEGLQLVLVLNTILKDLLDFSGGNFLAFFVGDALAEEGLQ